MQFYVFFFVKDDIPCLVAVKKFLLIVLELMKVWNKPKLVA